jgi:hypothetical protein
MNVIYVAETKFLEVYIMETSKWNTHVQPLENKLSKVSFMIKSLKEIMSPHMIHNIYFQSSNCFYGLQYNFGGERRIIQIKQNLEYKKG